MADHADPSFADKDAADETDDVELQVLCLTGEGVTLSVRGSMLGSDLRRLVSEKLPCKQGARLVVHHGNGELKLDENLAEQGIVGKSAMLSCTYIPTNLYAAWLYACGSAFELLNCEREFALEGVTHLEAEMLPEYLHHLPSSLASITFRDHFQPKPGVRDTAEESSKLEFWQCFQPKPGAGDLAIVSSILEFGP